MPDNCKTVAAISSYQDTETRKSSTLALSPKSTFTFLIWRENLSRLTLSFQCLSEDLMKSVNQINIFLFLSVFNIGLSGTGLRVVMVKPRLLAGYFSSLSYSLVSSAQIWSWEGKGREDNQPTKN